MSTATKLPKTPTLRGLRKLLLNPNLWPKGFTWSYLEEEETCAIGLAEVTWPAFQSRKPETFRLTYSEHASIFYYAWRKYPLHEQIVPFSEVRPSHVVAAIDRVLAARRAAP